MLSLEVNRFGSSLHDTQWDLQPCFSNFNLPPNYLSNLVKMQIQNQEGEGEAPESHF